MKIQIKIKPVKPSKLGGDLKKERKTFSDEPPSKLNIYLKKNDKIGAKKKEQTIKPGKVRSNRDGGGFTMSDKKKKVKKKNTKRYKNIIPLKKKNRKRRSNENKITPNQQW